MRKIAAVCVYCGSSAGEKPAYAEAAVALGKALSENDLGLVYGGGSVGLMGILAHAVLQHGGTVTGVIPQFLADREIMLKQAHELIVTEDMHERKKLMFERADAFVALPGGIGTLEELIEMLTWAQLGRHRKPVLLANVDGFWNPLLDLLNHMAEEKFVRREFIERIVSVAHMDDIVPTLSRLAAGLDEVPARQFTDADVLSNL